MKQRCCEGSPEELRLMDKGLLNVWDDHRSITSWKKLEEAIDSLEKGHGKLAWMFRGEGSWKQDLRTSLEKDSEQYCVNRDKVEQGLIRRFKREYPKHSITVPAIGDEIEWLAIMQHHGAPTRLLDVTYSIYIGLYFALWKYKPEEKAALSCINQNWLIDGWDQKAPKGYFREFERDGHGRDLRLYQIVLKDRRPKVYVINPYHLHERLVLQQGGFLLPLDITKTFMTNLSYMPKDPRGKNGMRKYTERIVKIMISLKKDELQEVRYKLTRMNINNATLFPGIDGFARSLRDRLPFDEQRSGRRHGF